MTSSEATRLSAARNNAEWCASVCRSHDIPNAFGERAWRTTRPSPPYYPDAVTLHPDATPADVLPPTGAWSGYSVKDSFATLDLTDQGFTELFTARWLHRPADLATPTTTLRAERVTTASGLQDWHTAWHGDGTPPDVFRPALLADPTVLVLSFHRAGTFTGGAVLTRVSGPVGLSNLFATTTDDLPTIWSSAVAAASAHHPDTPIVGYEQDPTPALATGFTALDPLRVWFRS